MGKGNSLLLVTSMLLFGVDGLTDDEVRAVDDVVLQLGVS